MPRGTLSLTAKRRKRNGLASVQAVSCVSPEAGRVGFSCPPVRTYYVFFSYIFLYILLYIY